VKIARQARKHVSRHGEAMILFAVGAYRFAAPAADVEEIRDLQGIESIEDATKETSVAKVVATLQRGRRTYYVVDAARHFWISGVNGSRVMVLRGQPVAVRVESIDRMAEVGKTLPLPRAFRGEERRWYRGLVLIEDEVVPVLQMSSFLTAAEQVIAKAISSHRPGKGIPA
jgi:chemotaxis signal transduction protein